MADDVWVDAVRWEKIQRVVQAAIAYAEGTNPDDHHLDYELRAAIRELTREPTGDG